MTQADPHLVVRDIVKSFGGPPVVDDVSLSVERGEFISLLGPSGCGKTTLLRIMAGFERPDTGTVLLGGDDVTGTAPHRRPVGLVFQRGALFPHRTVAENVGYALRRQRMPKREAAVKVQEMLALVRLEGLGDRRPSQLSGGQSQRVALARALAAEPAVLLLDEPLSALDLKLRKEMQLELRHLQHRLGTTFVFVTHDQEEALVLSDRIVVMNEGRIVQLGTPRDVYDDPSSMFVSTFIGESNLLTGDVRGQAGDCAVVRVGTLDLLAASNGTPHAGPPRVALSIRPERVRVVPARTGREGWNEVDGVVEEVVFAGNRVRLRVSTPLGCDLWVEHPSSDDDLDPTGSATIVAWRTEDTRVIPAL